MPSSPFDFTSGRSMIMLPQYIDEGDIIDDPSLYGVTPSDPDFTGAGRNAYIKLIRTPTPADQKALGDEDEGVKVVTKKDYDAVLYTNIVDSTLLKWGMNSLGAGVGSINSKTFIQSKYIAGSEVYDELLGCLPAYCTIHVPRDALMMLEIGLKCADINHGAGAYDYGSGSLASPAQLAGTPWKADDGGSAPTLFNSATMLERDFNVTVNRDIGGIDSSGDISEIYRKPTGRKINVELEAFRANTTVLDDAEAMTARSLSRVLKTSVSTLTLSNVQFAGETEDMPPRTTTPLTIRYAGTATAVAVT